MASKIFEQSVDLVGPDNSSTFLAKGKPGPNDVTYGKHTFLINSGPGGMQKMMNEIEAGKTVKMI